MNLFNNSYIWIVASSIGQWCWRCYITHWIIVLLLSSSFILCLIFRPHREIESYSVFQLVWGRGIRGLFLQLISWSIVPACFPPIVPLPNNLLIAQIASPQQWLRLSSFDSATFWFATLLGQPSLGATVQAQQIGILMSSCELWANNKSLCVGLILCGSVGKGSRIEKCALFCCCMSIIGW